MIDKPRSPRKSKLNKDQKLEIAALLQDYQHNWTLLKLQKLIDQKYNIKISQVAIWRMIKDFHFSYITPRKKHYLQNKEQLSDFKKKRYPK